MSVAPPPATITISGTCFNANGTTMPSGYTVCLSVEGAAAMSTTTTDDSGNFAFALTNPTSGSRICVYLQGNSQMGATVDRINTSSVIVNIFENALNVYNHLSSIAMTNNDIGIACGNGDSGVFDNVTDNNLTLQSNIGLNILGNYTPGGDVTVGYSWACLSGVFTPESYTVNLISSQSGVSITSGGYAFNNLSITRTGGNSIVYQDNLVVNGNLTLTGSGSLIPQSTASPVPTATIFGSIIVGSSAMMSAMPKLKAEAVSDVHIDLNKHTVRISTKR